MCKSFYDDIQKSKIIIEKDYHYRIRKWRRMIGDEKEARSEKIIRDKNEVKKIMWNKKK